MGATAAVHPPDEILQSFGLGKLDQFSSESVGKHLEACDSCQRRVAELSSDEFLGRLQQARDKPDLSPPGWLPSAASSTEGRSNAAMPSARADTLPPELVDHPDYEIVRELGRGGMGVVYLVNNRLTGRLEVLKIIGRHLIERPGVGERFLREIRSAAKLQHPNIVTAYTAMRLGESLALAMEFVDGLDLAKVVKTKGALPIAHACYYIHQAALGLQHAHERGMVHRDIKPANLILARDGKRAILKVLDFGLAKVTIEGQVDAGLTREGQMLGTPDYIAPEQIRNAQSADIRADIYSLGCTFYYLLSGGPPFRGDHLWDIYQAHFSMDAQPLNFARPEVPVELAAVVAKMMAKEPGRRFQTPGEVSRALTPFLRKESGSIGAPNADLSQVGREAAQTRPIEISSIPTRTTTSVAPATAPPITGSPLPDRTEPKWESLIKIKETEPITEAAPPVAARAKREKPARLRPVKLATVLLFGVFAAVLGIVIVFRTPDGNLVLENVPDDAVVEVDGKTYVITPADGKRIEIQLKPGSHDVVVKRDGVELTGETVVIQSGRNSRLTVRRELAGTSTRHAREPKDLPRPTVEPSVPVIDRVSGGQTKTSTRTRVPDEAADRSRDVEGNEKRPPLNREALSSVGSWAIKAGELVQTNWAKGQMSTVLFGNTEWTDYDFTCELMCENAEGAANIFFRASDEGRKALVFVIPTGGRACWIEVWPEHPNAEQITVEGSGLYNLVEKKWYTVRVRVLGKNCLCTVSDGDKEVISLHFKSETRASGFVGLSTFGSSYRFRNIKVTSPDHKPLWAGPPDVGIEQASEAAVPAFKGTKQVPGATIAEERTPDSGSWHVEGDELVQTSLIDATSLTLVNKPVSNFDMRFKTKVESGEGGVWTLFHIAASGARPTFEYFEIGRSASTMAKVAFFENGLWNVDPHMKKDIPVSLGRWYNVFVEVREDKFRCELDDLEVFRGANNRFVAGRIGIGTTGTVSRFKDILITTADRQELWKGVPRLTRPRQNIDVKANDTTKNDQASAATKKNATPSPKEAQKNQANKTNGPVIARDVFVSLFNGRNLEGWIASNGNGNNWGANDGMLIADSTIDADGKNYLLTRRSYSECELQFQFQLAPNSESGMTFWASPDDIPWCIAINNGADLKGRIRLMWPNLRNENYWNPGADLPVDLNPEGQWNQMRVEIKEKSIKVTINGVQVMEKDPARIAGMTIVPATLQRRSGSLGFRNWKGAAWFQGIRIRQLPEEAVAKRHPDGPIAHDPFQPGSIWDGENPQISMKVIVRRGDTFTAEFRHGANMQRIRGAIVNGRITWYARDVEVVQGDRAHGTWGHVYGDKVSIEWNDTNLRDPQVTCVLRLRK
jgi:serine/threonine protein kinase